MDSCPSLPSESTEILCINIDLDDRLDDVIKLRFKQIFAQLNPVQWRISRVTLAAARLDQSTLRLKMTADASTLSFSEFAEQVNVLMQDFTVHEKDQVLGLARCSTSTPRGHLQHVSSTARCRLK